MINTKKSIHYYQAIAVLIGQIIGVGIFGLPFLIAKAGILSLLFFIIFIGCIQYFIHLVYANLVMVTPTYHQLPGYAEKYLGRESKQLVFFASLIANYSALLAYTIVTGAFLFQLLGPILGGSEFIYAITIFAIEAIIVFFGVHFLARVELFMAFLLLLVVGLITWRSWGVIDYNNYALVDWKYFLIPYGAMLFALDGSSVIPFVVQLLNRNKKEIRSVIKIGISISAIVTCLFALVIVGITGGQTTPDALGGIKSILNNGVVAFALIFGVLCVTTSFLGSAQSLVKTFNFDYQINKYLSWFFALAIPLLLYVAGVNNFISVISFAGAVSGGLISIVLITIISRNNNDAKKNILFNHRLPSFLLRGLIAMFAAGIFYEIFCFVLR
jgi:tyrosine-specific transport protein